MPLKDAMLKYVLNTHTGALVLTAVVTNLDRIIRGLLKVLTPAQVEAVIDKAAEAAKERVEKDAKP